MVEASGVSTKRSFQLMLSDINVTTSRGPNFCKSLSSPALRNAQALFLFVVFRNNAIQKGDAIVSLKEAIL
jgi:hypothetical protein